MGGPETRSSPTVETLVAFVAVFLAQSVAGLLGFAGLFVLRAPVDARPLSLVLSVYAHAGVGHLLANAVGLLLFGFAVERETTRLRFHAFFVATGVLAGVAEVLVGGLFVPGAGAAVLGASGAVFGLLGYLLAGNPVFGPVLDRLSRRAQAGVFALVALLVTLATSAPGVALVAHFTGLTTGLLAGRARLLRVRR